MKNFIEKIKNSFTQKKSQDPHIINPHKHWIMMLVSFLVIGGLLIIFSLYILYKIKNEQIFQSTPSTSTNSSNLKENLIKQVSESFEKKIEKTNEIKTKAPVFKDPSL